MDSAVVGLEIAVSLVSYKGCPPALILINALASAKACVGWIVGDTDEGHRGRELCTNSA